MTPYEIRILLHYYAITTDPPEMQINAPIWRPTIDQFLADGVLREREIGDREGAAYVMTPRGGAYVRALMSVPLPESVWLVRWPDKDARVED